MFQINQDNLHLLLPGKICWLVEYLHDDYGFTLQESLSRIYLRSYTRSWRQKARNTGTWALWTYTMS